MKRTILFVAILFCMTMGFAQTKQNKQQAKKDSTLTRIDSLIQATNAWLEQIEITNSLNNDTSYIKQITSIPYYS